MLGTCEWVKQEPPLQKALQRLPDGRGAPGRFDGAKTAGAPWGIFRVRNRPGAPRPARKDLVLIVYMLLNTVTELCYVGATTNTLDDRWHRHLKETRGRVGRLGQALLDWDVEVWTRVVLCYCYDELELSAAEQAWQQMTCCFEPAVGYNDNHDPYIATIKAGRKGGDPLKADVKSNSPLAGLSPDERREYFRAAGKRGAERSRARKGT